MKTSTGSGLKWNRANLARGLKASVEAARAAGALMRKRLHSVKKVNEEQQYDIKLELDVVCQQKIEKILHARFPEVSVLGEEGLRGDREAPARWVVDPIDGTVNFAHGIPHACVSIALQAQRGGMDPGPVHRPSFDGYETVVGVVFDPFCDELWTAIRGGPAFLNGKRIRVSRRSQLGQAIVAVGFAKKAESMRTMLETFNRLVSRVRKIRMMGSAALSLTYVATGRFDAYLESGVRLWDIAAGGLIVECAGGEFQRTLLPKDETYALNANNGLLRGLETKHMRLQK